MSNAAEDTREGHDGVRPLAELIGPALDSITDRERGLPADAVPTGFTDLDRLTGHGLPLGSTTAVFGHSGVGASAFVVNLAAHAAINHEEAIPALVVSWESTREALLTRIISQTGRIPRSRITSTRLEEEDRARLAAVRSRVADRPLALGAGPTSFAALERLVDDWTAAPSGPRRLLVLDGLPHLARLAPAGVDTSVWDAHTRITAQLKHLALSRRIAVVYTVPTVVDVLRRSDTIQPQIGDVAYSPAYVTDADLVIGIHRPDLKDRESPRAGEADLCVLKHTNGPTDLITLAWQGHYQRFVDMRF